MTASPQEAEPLIAIRNLSVSFATGAGPADVLCNVSLDLGRGRVVGLVGESGSGKSTLASAIPRLLPRNLSRLEGTIRYDGRDLLALPDRELATLRGTRFAMIFQDPMAALNPVFRIGTQLVDLQRAKRPRESRRALLARAAAMLARVGIPDAERRLSDYPHQFSGGMRQRIMIAAALLAEPDLLIADEPTTALDPTIEGQIVALIEELRQEYQGTILLIAHSLGLVSQLCDDVAVLYAGTLVESGPAAAVLGDPRHPYTRALLACELGVDVARRATLASIPGEVPDVTRIPPGCVFAPRCPQAAEPCRAAVPPLRALGDGRSVACALV
ncbi:oligopeptide transport ATP-binding protein (plasmid) [Azospirillum sp. B510]|uniref:ABC transporter ATP-binding protein n=1 Tax=Azospirillum sp. (strain B510) TaxID=137722 RepID=UPI0001C4B87B|nr:ABC transporter ATP-binding protein [Azospirillum sp. B510]BAI73632.1 oligopeptide transport ATP-binding protein [Azospirillum sp. B510]